MSELEELVSGAATAAGGAARRWSTWGGSRVCSVLVARLVGRPGETVLHHAGYLAVHVSCWLDEYGKRFGMPRMLTAAASGFG